MKSLIIFFSLVLFSVTVNAQAFTGRTANNALFVRYTDTTGVVPLIGNNTVAFLFRVADSSIYWWTNVRKTWTLYTTGGTPGLAAVIASSNTISANTTLAATTTHTTGISGTAGFFIPSGTTTQRPGSPTAWMLRFNTDSSGAAALEYYNPNSSTWVDFTATGGGGGGSPGGSTGNIQYNASGSFAGSSNWLWNTTANGAKIISPALATTPAFASGLYLQNATAAATSAQQISPGVTWEGQGWKTTSTAASQPVAYTAYVTPVQGTTAPGGYWSLYGSVNGGTLYEALRVSTPGAAGNITLWPTTAGNGGQQLVFGNSGTDYISFSGRRDFALGGMYFSSRGANFTLNVGSVADPSSSYNTGIFEPVSTTLAQISAAYNGTVYTTFLTNSSGKMTIAPTGGKLAITGYGSGTNTGTATYAANFDASGNLIEGTLSGANTWSQTANGTALTNSVTQTSILGTTATGSLTIPANTLTVGKIVTMHGYLIVSHGSLGGSLQLLPDIGSSGQNITIGAPATSYVGVIYEITAQYTITTTGTSATAYAFLKITDAAAGTTTLANFGSITIGNTASTIALDFQASWASASTSNSIQTLPNFTVKID